MPWTFPQLFIKRMQEDFPSNDPAVRESQWRMPVGTDPFTEPSGAPHLEKGVRESTTAALQNLEKIRNQAQKKIDK